MTTESILLNGSLYNRHNLDKLLVIDEASDSWRNAIFHFLQNWFDDSDYILAQTSGSTGKPKDIHLLKNSMENSARVTNQFFGLSATDTAILCLPTSYIAGKMMLVRAMVGGFNLIAVEPTANPFEKLKITIDFTAITPYQLQHSVKTLQTKVVRKIIVGGSPVTSKLEKLAKDIPSELFETYGMTETCSHVALRRFNGKDKSDCFTILNGVSIRQDQRGCLVVKVPHLMDEEIITNDIVELVGRNSFRWLGRADSVINSGGIKIHPEQIEKKMEGIIPTNFFITSIPDELLENKVVLVIESNPYTSGEEEDLKVKIENILGKYELPKQILYLPRFIYSQSNKVLCKETLAKASN